MVTVTINAIFWLKVLSILITATLVGYLCYEWGCSKTADSLAGVIDGIMSGRGEMVTVTRTLEEEDEEVSPTLDNETETALLEGKIKDLEEENAMLRDMVEQLKAELCNDEEE